MLEKRANFYFIIILIFFIVLKVFIGLTSTDLGDSEECIRGAIAEILLSSSPDVSWFQMQQDPYTGGSIISGVLASPLFFLFGSHSFVLKLVPMIVSILILIYTYVFVKSFFSPKAAMVTSLALLVSPYFFTRLSLTAWGGYLDSLLFTVLILLIFFKIFFSKASTPYKNNQLFFWFGFVSGLAFWDQYSILATLLLCFIFWFVFDKLFFSKKPFFIYLGSFILGAIPWLIYNFKYGFAALSYPGNPGTFESLFSRVLESFNFNSLANFFAFSLPSSFSFEAFSIFSPTFLNYSYYLLFVLSFFLLVLLNKKSIVILIKNIFSQRKTDLREYKETLLILFIPLFYFVFQIAGLFVNSDLGWKGYLHLSLFHIYAFIIIGLAISKIIDKKNSTIKVIIGVFIALIALQCLISNLQFISFDNFSIDNEEVSCIEGMAINAGYNYRHFLNGEEHRLEDYCSSFEIKEIIVACMRGVNAT